MIPLFIEHLHIYDIYAIKWFSVITTSQDTCEPGDILKITSPSRGNIASITTRETGCGSESSPWLIEAPLGQRIRFTLLDFTSTDRTDQSSICLMYAKIKVSSVYVQKRASANHPHIS